MNRTRLQGWVGVVGEPSQIDARQPDGGDDRRRLDGGVPYWAVQSTGDADCQGKSDA